MKVVHLTSVHGRYDVRIFLKECRSLKDAGFDVSIVVADGKGDEVKDGIPILDVGRLPGRIRRMTLTTRNVLRKAMLLDADLYHMHDPELIPVGLRLAARGKKVVFDAHEDLPKQIMSKSYLSPFLRHCASKLAETIERFAFPRFTGLVAATPTIEQKLRSYSQKTVTVCNFPLAGELDAAPGEVPKANEVCYIGGISTARGIRPLVQAMNLTSADIRLNLAGPVAEKGLLENLQALPGWDRVNELGVIGRKEVRDVLARSIAGIVTLMPTPNHMDSLPIKMFEYMSAGIPVIASHFPLWRDIVEGTECGFCVDPTKPEELAAVIDHLVNNPQAALAMGERGKEAVKRRYNWPAEAEKLLAFYKSV